MLQLRPSCEHCARPLPPDSGEARICSYECTFCRGCVEHVLDGVCPNCGGGFTPRPVRTARTWVAGTGLDVHPASATVVHKPVEVEAHAALVACVGEIPPAER